MAMQDMKGSLNLLQAQQPDDLAKPAPATAPAGKSGYRAAQTRNYAQQVQVVNGRAFYQNGSVWTDATAQAKKALRQKQIRFGSAEYFDLLKKNPGTAAVAGAGKQRGCRRRRHAGQHQGIATEGE